MTKEGAINAAQAIAERYLRPRYDKPAGREDSGSSIKHLLWMADEMRTNKAMTTNKIMRWLGYIQGCLVIGKIATLSQMKELSKEFAENGTD